MLSSPSSPPSIRQLFFNHLTAWAMGFGIATMALFVHQAFTPQTILLLFGIALGYWLGFALNDFYDAPFDAQQPSKAAGNYFIDNAFAQRLFARLLCIVVIMLVIIFAQFGLKGLGLLGLCFVVMWAYSAPPLRLKSRPVLDLLTHAIFVEAFPYWLCLILIDAVWVDLDYIALTLAFLASLTAQLEQQIRDYDLDRKTDTNFTTSVGVTTSVRLLAATTILGLLILGGFIIVGTIPWYLAIAFFIVAPIIWHRFRYRFRQPPSQRVFTTCAILGLIYVGGLFIYVVVDRLS
ncbi:MAG: UbiA family prenyltransferase [Chloroflexota bacterium]